MLKKNKYLLIFITLHFSSFVFSQTKEELKQQKSVIEKKITYTTELLNKTQKNKNKSLNYLNALNIQIKNQKQLLERVSIEIKLIAKQIKKTENKIKNINQNIIKEEKKLQLLKEEYAKMIYSLFIKKGNRTDLMFVISSEDFNQAYKRIKYLKQYSFSRKNQIKKIKETQQNLYESKDKIALEQKKLINESELKNNLIQEKKEDIISINSTKKEKQEILNKLSKSEQALKKELKDQQIMTKKLDDKIRKIIEDEIRKAREKANKERPGNYSLTPESEALSAEFGLNKGKLPWPVDKGVIIQFYGKQKHPVLSNVETVNNGIDIATDKNTEVRAIFDGVVSRIFFIKGEGKAILIMHGEYFSVYSGLREVFVKSGEKVLAKEKLGIVITQEAENKTELHFEIWKGYDKQDPSKWLFKAY